MICDPDDALDMFYGSDLQPLMMENAPLRSASAVAGMTESQVCRFIVPGSHRRSGT
jgi:hypothetical protein